MTLRKQILLPLGLILISLFLFSSASSIRQMDEVESTIEPIGLIKKEKPKIDDSLDLEQNKLADIGNELTLETNYDMVSGYGWGVDEIVEDNQPLSDLTVAVDGSGNSHIFWSGRISTDWYLFYKIRYENGTWSSLINLGEIKFEFNGVLDAKSDDLGRIHLTWKKMNGIYYRCYNHTDQQWTEPLFIANGEQPTLLLNNASIPRIGYTFTRQYELFFYYAKLNAALDKVTTYNIPLPYYSAWGLEIFNFEFGLVHEDGRERCYFFLTSIIQAGYYYYITYTLESYLFWQENNTAPFEIIGYYQEEVDDTQYSLAKPIILGSDDGYLHLFYQKPASSSTYQYIYIRRTPEHVYQAGVVLTEKLALNCQISGLIDDNGRITLAWNYVQYEGTTTAKVYIKTYSDLYNSWTNDQNITAGDAYSQYPTFDIDLEGNIHLVWVDQVGNDRIIYYKKGLVDSDEDGIINVEETDIYLTDPYDADTDDDMFKDGEEILGIYAPGHPNATDDYLYFDPFNPDEDSDGMYDGFEYRYGLDPFTNDASLDFDNDNLTNLEEFQELTYPNNNDTDSDLVDDYTELKIAFSDPKDSDTDDDKVTDYDEIKVLYSNPNSADSDNDTMSDFYESNYRDFVDINVNDTALDPDGDGLINLYEFQWNISPGNPDHENDGLNDYQEVMVWGTHPITFDTDADGLWDGPEVNGIKDAANVGANATGYVHTNPTLKDTDGDTLNDNAELAANTDPNNPDSDGDLIWDGYENSFGLDYHDISDKELDPDGDGLTNYEEFLLWTNPFETDTDGDQFTDFEEVGLGIDPTKADTDGDGLDDYNEIIVLGIDPNDTDTDGDYLDDYLEVHTYNSDPKAIDSDGDTLLDGDEVYNHTTHPAMKDTDGDLINDNIELDNNFDPTIIDTEGDGMEDYFEYIYGLDPRVDDSQIDTDADGIVNIEEFINNANPLVNDTDLDGLTDFEEIAVYFTEPDKVDTDKDGLTDYDEITVYSSNPLDPDTDDDKILDGQEVLYGTDILLSDTDSDGLSDGEEIADNTNPLDANDNKYKDRVKLILITFSSIAGIIVIYYVSPFLIAKLRKEDEVEWVLQGLKWRREKSNKLINGKETTNESNDE